MYKKKKVFTDCCLNGQLHGAIPPLIPHPDELESLLAGTTDESRLFLNNTRTYNNRFAFASIVGKFRDQKDLAGTGVSPVVLQGSLCHKISPLSPLASGSAAFGQVYFLDDETALKHRLSLNQLAGSRNNRARQDESNMRVITTMMEQINPFVKWFKCAKEILTEAAKSVANGGVSHHVIVLRADPNVGPNEDKRTYSLPTANEVAVLIENEAKKRALTFW
jgi:hypothetical protein